MIALGDDETQHHELRHSERQIKVWKDEERHILESQSEILQSPELREWTPWHGEYQRLTKKGSTIDYPLREQRVG
jgi:hypothetical protein